ncbi:Aldo/keto reductase [Massarina eburnea CBS 473.64]|uniref:Aldo/keto reductase n=1 Tax=Massarina eburnea CBS 473.64 TaxID=1395130 RepID=A0A6A6S6N6_9PLEO|nr:Aldo/keto reductase [Massarina eburnea CBS 473.64]
MAQTKLDIIFGAMSFGKEGIEQVRTSSLDDCAAILDTFQSHNHTEVDTSRFYGDGTSEEYLAALNWQTRGLVVHTKFFPNTPGLFNRPAMHLDEAGMRGGLETSLKTLKAEKEGVELWYLHAPDRGVPLETTLITVNDLYKEGKFKTWGISNFMAWEVAAICEICDKNNYPRPSVYQGTYNALFRTIEHELLPCLRKYGIAFYAYNPLAGGYLTDRYHRLTKNNDIEAGSRFDANRMQGQMYRLRYWNDAFFDALDILRPVAKKHGIREAEAALKWCMHHGELKREFGDKIIIGASSKEQLEANLKDFEGGELPQEVLTAFDQGWEKTRGVTWKYFH